LDGEYILPIETKFKWTLKECNKLWRKKKMEKTINLMNKMVFRWE